MTVDCGIAKEHNEYWAAVLTVCLCMRDLFVLQELWLLQHH